MHICFLKHLIPRADKCINCFRLFFDNNTNIFEIKECILWKEDLFFLISIPIKFMHISLFLNNSLNLL